MFIDFGLFYADLMFRMTTRDSREGSQTQCSGMGNLIRDLDDGGLKRKIAPQYTIIFSSAVCCSLFERGSMEVEMERQSQSWC